MAIENGIFVLFFRFFLLEADMSGGMKIRCQISVKFPIWISLLVELDLICPEIDVDDFSSVASMYLSNFHEGNVEI